MAPNIYIFSNQYVPSWQGFDVIDYKKKKEFLYRGRAL